MSRARWSDAALARLRGFATADEPLAPYTTYRLGGPARVWAVPRAREELALVGEVARTLEVPLLLVGRGSNLLVADEGFDGIAVSLSVIGEWLEIDGSTVRAGAAAALPVVARRCAAAGLTGFEWAVGVPGSIGGAVRMNAGGHGGDMAACVVEVELHDLLTGRSGVVPVDQLGLRFRGSALADHQVVLQAGLHLERGDPRRAEATIAEVVRWRREHQPGGQNAGSVFVNPIPGELPAAVLIDRLGLRGYRVGGAHVSEKHANFVQAEPGARAADVVAVMRHVRERVIAATGIVLRTEVRLVGFGALGDELVGAAGHGAGVQW